MNFDWDELTIKERFLVMEILITCHKFKDEYGLAQPFLIPPSLALEIARVVSEHP